ncbi:MAG TPA: hypothetical protein PLP19_11330 [bacterium]|nr:hypothetical protein [bacterium]HPN44074.1 hypothetical protein [bacterium]
MKPITREQADHLVKIHTVQNTAVKQTGKGLQILITLANNNNITVVYNSSDHKELYYITEEANA